MKNNLDGKGGIVSVSSPALDSWHRSFVGEAANRCLKPLSVYEDMPCFCFLGNPRRTREPCVKGHCPNITDMPRKVLDAVIAYANRRANIDDIHAIEREGKCYQGPSWIKSLMSITASAPKHILSWPSPYAKLDQDVQEFLDRYI